MAETPEAVALALLQRVAESEHWSGMAGGGGTWTNNVDRKKILDAYAECLQAVQAPGARLSGSRA